VLALGILTFPSALRHPKAAPSFQESIQSGLSGLRHCLSPVHTAPRLAHHHDRWTTPQYHHTCPSLMMAYSPAIPSFLFYFTYMLIRHVSQLCPHNPVSALCVCCTCLTLCPLYAPHLYLHLPHELDLHTDQMHLSAMTTLFHSSHLLYTPSHILVTSYISHAWSSIPSNSCT